MYILWSSPQYIQLHIPGSSQVTLTLVLRNPDLDIVRSILFLLMGIHLCLKSSHNFASVELL